MFFFIYFFPERLSHLFLQQTSGVSTPPTVSGPHMQDFSSTLLSHPFLSSLCSLSLPPYRPGQWLRSSQKTHASVWSATICPRSSRPCSRAAPGSASARCPRSKWSPGWSTSSSRRSECVVGVDSTKILFLFSVLSWSSTKCSPIKE